MSVANGSNSATPTTLLSIKTKGSIFQLIEHKFIDQFQFYFFSKRLFQNFFFSS
jgi:hypothetical protein